MNAQDSRLRNPTRKLFSVIVVLLSVAGSSVGLANTISYSLGFNLNPASTAEVLHFQPFDLSLGTLENVEISFNATRRHDWAVWNISGQAGAVSYTDVSLTGSVLSLGGTNFGFSDLAYGSGATGVLASVSFPTYFAEVEAGRAQFLTGSDAVYPSAENPASKLTPLSGFFSPLGFSSDLNLSYDPGLFAISAENFLSTSLVEIAGTATLTYTYSNVASVPDSLPGLILPALLGGLLLAARARRPGCRTAI